MALKTLADAVGNWNMTIPFPKDAYVLRCMSEEIKPASTGSPMIVREWEIVSPTSIPIGDKTYNIAGALVRQNMVFKVKAEDGSWDEKKSDSSFSRMTEELKTLGFEGTEVDDENPPLIAKGKLVNAIVSGKEDVQRRAPTAEQLTKGLKQGDKILVNGKEVKVYNLNLNQIVGLADGTSVSSASAFNSVGAAGAL